MTSSWKNKLIVALDVADRGKALDIVEKLGDQAGVFKVGFELFVTAGPGIVEDIQKMGKKVFLDLKFHDIPNTVSGAARAAARLGVYMFNVHTAGGLAMMKQCVDAVSELCEKERIQRPRIIGVTALTSLDGEILRNELGVHYSLRTQVKRLASLALSAGLDGVVASPHETIMIKNQCGNNFLVVTPGIRPSWVPPDDQKRTATPREALRNGADYIVMGRGILKHEDPVRALELISLEMLTA
jgi:orotidine-5'-phosphate decarboxylase